MKAKRLNMRERNLQPAEEPVEEATPPEPDPALVSYGGLTGSEARYFTGEIDGVKFDYGEGKTAEEEMAAQRILAVLAFTLLLVTVAAGLGILILLLR